MLGTAATKRSQRGERLGRRARVSPGWLNVEAGHGHDALGVGVGRAGRARAPPPPRRRRLPRAREQLGDSVPTSRRSRTRASYSLSRSPRVSVGRPAGDVIARSRRSAEASPSSTARARPGRSRTPGRAPRCGRGCSAARPASMAHRDVRRVGVPAAAARAQQAGRRVVRAAAAEEDAELGQVRGRRTGRRRSRARARRSAAAACPRASGRRGLALAAGDRARYRHDRRLGLADDEPVEGRAREREVVRATETWYPSTAITAAGCRRRTRSATATAAEYCSADQHETTTRSAGRAARSSSARARKLPAPPASPGLPQLDLEVEDVDGEARAAQLGRQADQLRLDPGPSAHRPPYSEPGNTSRTRSLLHLVSVAGATVGRGRRAAATGGLWTRGARAAKTPWTRLADRLAVTPRPSHPDRRPRRTPDSRGSTRVSEVGVMVQGDVDHADDVSRTRLDAGAAGFAGASVQSHVGRLVVVVGRSRSHQPPQTGRQPPMRARTMWPRARRRSLGGRTALFGEKRRPPDTSATWRRYAVQLRTTCHVANPMNSSAHVQ